MKNIKIGEKSARARERERDCGSAMMTSSYALCCQCRRPLFCSTRENLFRVHYSTSSFIHNNIAFASLRVLCCRREIACNRAKQSAKRERENLYTQAHRTAACDADVVVNARTLDETRKADSVLRTFEWMIPLWSVVISKHTSYWPKVSVKHNELMQCLQRRRVWTRTPPIVHVCGRRIAVASQQLTIDPARVSTNLNFPFDVHVSWMCDFVRSRSHPLSGGDWPPFLCTLWFCDGRWLISRCIGHAKNRFNVLIWSQNGMESEWDAFLFDTRNCIALDATIHI